MTDLIALLEKADPMSGPARAQERYQLVLEALRAVGCGPEDKPGLEAAVIAVARRIRQMDAVNGGLNGRHS